MSTNIIGLPMLLFTPASGKDSIAHVIYQNSGDSEATKRPRADYMEMVQEDIMQATAIDWLVRVAGEYRLLPETLFLTVN
ncbi:hypothetical protein Golob_000794 [Gossypium lobatum]|uniref:Cyclin N-terminal domain-containing protein n=1 Tax=Gossypium lobatum TaxID=34289 RepID=A0A7J8N9F7_9ROSI|nr:hypothetical protein [Gossypium lobatum]